MATKRTTRITLTTAGLLLLGVAGVGLFGVTACNESQPASVSRSTTEEVSADSPSPDVQLAPVETVKPEAALKTRSVSAPLGGESGAASTAKMVPASSPPPPPEPMAEREMAPRRTTARRPPPTQKLPRSVVAGNKADDFKRVAGKRPNRPTKKGKGKDKVTGISAYDYERQIRGAEEKAQFDGREAWVNRMTITEEDRLSTFAIDVDTAAYSIARRSIRSGGRPTPSLVRVEEFINYFRYDYQPPQDPRALFSIEADGARSPIDENKHLLRVGIQSKIVEPAERMPANLVFLVDTSCSMTSGDKLRLAKASMNVALEQVGRRDRVAITTYAGGVRLVLPPTRGNQKRRIKKAINQLRTGGGTAMASGMQLAYQQAAKMLGSGSITRIIVFSDGDANIGRTSPDQILKSIEGYVKEGVTLSTIGFGTGNYKDVMMERLANKGNGNYYYVDSQRQAERIFGRDFTRMVQDVAQDVKIQVDFDPKAVRAYRLIGYENRDVRDQDFRNDQVDAGEIGAGHQVTALYELTLTENAEGHLATVRVRAKKPRGMKARETALHVRREHVERSFVQAADTLRFATAVMGAAEILRESPYAHGWSIDRVIAIAEKTRTDRDADRREFIQLMRSVRNRVPSRGVARAEH